MDKLDQDEAVLAAVFYDKAGDYYKLSPDMDEFEAEDPLYSLPALGWGRLSSSAVDDFVDAVKKAGLAQDEATLKAPSQPSQPPWTKPTGRR